MKKIIFCLIVCSLFSLASCNNELLGEKISFEEANQIISNYSITEIHSFSLSSCFSNKTILYLDENNIVSTESNFYGNSFADDNVENPYAFLGSLNYSLSNGELVKENTSISIEEYMRFNDSFVYSTYYAQFDDDSGELNIRKGNGPLYDVNQILSNVNNLTTSLETNYHYLNLKDYMTLSMYDYYKLNDNLSLVLTFNKDNIAQFIDISSLGDISTEDLDVIGEEIYTFNKDGFILKHSINLSLKTNFKNKYSQMEIELTSNDEVTYNLANVSTPRCNEYVKKYLEHIE